MEIHIVYVMPCGTSHLKFATRETAKGGMNGEGWESGHYFICTF